MMTPTVKWRQKSRFVLFASLCLTIPVAALGQGARKSALGVQFGLGLNTTSVKTAPANTQGIGTRGIGFLFSASPRVHQIFAIHLDAGLEFVDDKQQFTQLTTGGTKSSSVALLFGSIAAGISTPPIQLSNKPQGGRLAIGLNVGSDWVGGERSIDNCIDCHKEDLDLSGGGYLESMLQIYFSRRSGVGISYRNYNDQSDLNNRVILKYIHLL